MIQAKDIQLVKIKDVKLNPKNRNKHPKEQIERLAEIIKYQGFRNPLIISSRTGLVVAGHGRYEAAKLLGLKEVPVMVQDFESEEQEYAAQVSDNAIASWAELDLSGINADIGDLGPDFDIDLLGIKDFVVEPAEKFEAQSDEDELPEHVEPKTKLGDIYQLGRHRLMCGDSTSIDAVEKLMDGQRADMVFTDPPYGINLDTDYTKMGDASQNHRRVANDDKPFDAYTLANHFLDAKEQFWFGANYYIESFKRQYGEGSWFVWDKYPTDQNDKRFGSLFEMIWSKQRHKQVLVRIASLNVGHFKAEDIVHPTQKPSDLIKWFLEKYSELGNAVVDLFGGSGSTLIACEKTNRKCFMMELDPHYCDVIISRWERYTGKKAELISGQT